MLLSILSKVDSSYAFTIGWDFFIVFTSWSLCLPKKNRKNITMNNTLWTDTLTFACKTEIKNVFINMLTTCLFKWNSWHQKTVVIKSWHWQISWCVTILRILRLTWWSLFNRSAECSLSSWLRNHFCKFSNTLLIKRSQLWTNFTLDTLSYLINNLHQLSSFSLIQPQAYQQHIEDTNHECMKALKYLQVFFCIVNKVVVRPFVEFVIFYRKLKLK